MSYNIIGIILISAPFLAVFFYPSIKEGLLKIILYVTVFHLALSIITQAFHIFNYPVVMGANTIFVLFLLCFLFIRKRKNQLLFIDVWLLIKNGLKNNWIFFIAIVIIFFQLFSVHNSYIGIVQTFRGFQNVSDSTYIYPFVSDEWVTISEIKYSIDNQALPIVNPLDHNIPIPNVLFVFPSILSEIFLLIGFNPLTQYWVVSIFFALILCTSLYIYLKKYKVSSAIAASSMLCIPYIVNSGNLLALWSFLPFTLGTILMLWQLISQKFGNDKDLIFFAVLSLLVYPPIVVFVIPVLFIYIYNNQKSVIKNTKHNILQYFIPIGICIFVFAIIFYLVLNHFDMTIMEVLNKYIIRPNPDGGIVSYSLFNVIPKIVVFFGFIGLFRIVKNKYYDLVVVISIGLFYWCMYAFLNKVFIIEYPRIVFVSSFFISIIAGIGCEWFVLFLIKETGYNNFTKYILNSAGILVIVISILSLQSYSSRVLWKNLTLNVVDEMGVEKKIIPAPPINRYFTEDDLKLFKNINEKNFIAPPWKGLVIGVATGNFPFETKPATIGNRIFSYNEFMYLNCENKNQIAKKYYVSYVYSEQFSCPNFNMIGSSSENLYLYKYSNNEVF